MKVTEQRRLKLTLAALAASVIVAVLACLVMTVPATRTTSAATLSAAGAQAAAGAAPLAGRIKPGVAYHGVATFYDTGNGDGACLFGPSKAVMTAAMNHTDYETAKACGAYIRVHSADGHSITVRITNECPLPCEPGHLDLSPQAFAKLANPQLGRIPITWKLLSPKTTRKIAVRYKTGSTRWWCGIQVIDHRNPIALLQVRTAGRWKKLPRTEYNYFLSAKGTGCGGQIRITDIYGQHLIVRGIKLKAGVIQRTKAQFARH